MRDADLRGARRLFTVESPRVVRRFLRSGWPIESVLLESPVAEELQSELDALEKTVAVYVVAHRALNHISGYEFHNGALALGQRNAVPPTALDFEQCVLRERALILAADAVVHVDNMGGLFRNGACLGASGLLLGQGCADPLFRKTVRISSGWVFSLPWQRTECLAERLVQLRDQHGFEILGLELSAESVPLASIQPAQKTVLVLGAEGAGLSDDVLDACTRVAQIPVRTHANEPDQPSLNVATASAIALHDLLGRLPSDDFD